MATPRYALKSNTNPPDSSSRLARFLRRTHLDELPQLLLVPFGTMSLVGPRPKMPDAYEPVDPGYRATRLRVRQGCTGLWQIGPDTDRLPDEAPEYDAFYVEQATLRLDLWILWRTVLCMTKIGRPVPLERIPQWLLRASSRLPVEARDRQPQTTVIASPFMVSTSAPASFE